MMLHSDIFRLAADEGLVREAAGRLFAVMKRELGANLPAAAEVLHIGATAVHGCLTKGNLDIVVRVERADFEAAEAVLAARFARNLSSDIAGGFSSFSDDRFTPHLGIQLTVKGEPFDIFHDFAAALRADPDLVRRYNALKLSYDGLSMDHYTKAEEDFIADVLLASQRD